MADFTYSIEERNEWIARFEEQRARIERDLLEGEEIKHCIDIESFGGRYYDPHWVITSEARIWSLVNEDWNTPYLHESTRRWYASNDWHETQDRLGLKNVRVYYHQIVANYFCDKTAIDLYGENNCAPHHLFRYRHLLDDGMVQTRREDCTWNNRAKHLRWVSKTDHAILSYIQDAWHQNQTIDTVIDKMMNEGIKHRDRYTGEYYTASFEGMSREDFYVGYKEIFENGKFYDILRDNDGNVIRDENGRPLKRDQWTALWCEYKKIEDNGVHMRIDKSTKVKAFTLSDGLPYIK